MTNPVCVGTGLVALDIIYNDGEQLPTFLAGGSCGNVLTILASLGWKTFPIARLGNDKEGKRVIEDMKKWGTGTDFLLQESQTKTPRIIERVFTGQRPYHRFYLKCKHGRWLPHRKVITLKLFKIIQNQLPPSNIFYFDRAMPSAYKLACYLKQSGAIIVFEPPRFLSSNLFLQCLKIADIVKYCDGRTTSLEKLGITAPLEIQTMGEDGLQYRTNFLRNNDWRTLPPFPVHNLIDAAGSGDWSSAGMIHCLQYHKDIMSITRKRLETALDFGQALASLNCNYVGARGMMYCLPQIIIVKSAKQMMDNRKLVINLRSAEIKIESKSAVKCRVCLCAE